MASLIRMPGETDAEYQRRASACSALPLFWRQAAKVLENNNALEKHFRIAALRESCGVAPIRGEPFKRKTSGDV